jgi:hypothetical protein
MSKFLTTLFLTIATLLSGLVMATPTINVSAALNDPLRCSFPGRYIDRAQAVAPCVSCPVDFYCPTQIRNGSDGKPSQFSPEKPGKNGQLNSEIIPCPSGSTTLGFTYHPYKLSLLTKDEDGFAVGTLATDMSMCRTPDFKCPASTPRLVNVNGKSSCFSACPSEQVEVIKDGVQSCIIQCRTGETSVNGKCYESCKDDSTLTIINGVVNCNDKCLNSPIRGQIVGPKGNCICPTGTQIIIDADNYSTGRCGVVVISSSSSSSVSSALVCNNNETFINGKCYPACPSGSTLTIVNGIVSCVTNSSSVSSSSVSSSSIIPVLPCPIPGQIRSYGTCACPLPNYAVQQSNGNKSCAICPADNTIVQVGIEKTGEIIYKCEAPKPVENNGGGGGSDFWTYAGIALGGYLLFDGFSCGGLFNFGDCSSPAPAVVTPNNTEVFGPVYQPSTTNCPLDRRPQSTNNGTICVCEYGTVDFYGNCGIEIDVPSPKIPTNAKPRNRDFDENAFLNYDNNTDLFAFDGGFTDYTPVAYNNNTDLFASNYSDYYAPVAFDGGFTDYTPVAYNNNTDLFASNYSDYYAPVAFDGGFTDYTPVAYNNDTDLFASNYNTEYYNS